MSPTGTAEVRAALPEASRDALDFLPTSFHTTLSIQRFLIQEEWAPQSLPASLQVTANVL